MKKNLLFLSMAALVLFGATACDEDSFDETPPTFGISSNEITLSASAGTYDFEVYTNRNYRVELLDKVNWLTLSAGEAVNDVAVVGLKYDANDGFSRMARFTVLSEVEEMLCDTVVVKQRAGKDPVLSFADNQVTLAGAGGEDEIPIVTNISLEDMSVVIEYKEEDAGEWVTSLSLADVDGTDNRVLKIGFAANPSDSPRSATAEFSFTDGWGNHYSAEIGLLQRSKDETTFTIVSFETLRETYATGKEITDYVGIKGIVVSNKEYGNAGEPEQRSASVIDFTPVPTTVYLESEDGKYGIVIRTSKEEDNIFDQFDSVTLLLTGMTLSAKENPARYELSGFSTTLVDSRKAGAFEDVPVKERSISALTDDDLYTYVKLTEVELPIRKGSLFPVDGGFTSANDYQCITKWPLLVRDKNGDDMFMLTNDKCTYSRDGSRLPYGSGSLYGVIVHEHFSHYEWANGHTNVYSDIEAEQADESLGNIGRYQLRHQTKEDIYRDMEDDFEDGFSALLCEYRYHNVVNDTIAKPSYGDNGYLDHTFKRKYTGTGSKSYAYELGIFFQAGNTTYDYLGPIGRVESYVHGVNYGNRNGLGIVIDSAHESMDYMSDRFAMNDDGKYELACQYAENEYCGYGTQGWSEANSTSSLYQNVPNRHSTASNDGKGYTQASAKLDYSNTYWWDDDYDTPYGYLLYVSTAGISSSVVSLQLAMRAATNTFYTPRYWTVEWATTDEHLYAAQYDDSKWTYIGEFTVPDCAVLNNSNQWQLPGNKPVNITLPQDILGQENVYIRIRPTTDRCSSGADYDDAQLKNCSAGKAQASSHGISMSYLAIRYNK